MSGLWVKLKAAQRAGDEAERLRLIDEAVKATERICNR